MHFELCWLAELSKVAVCVCVMFDFHTILLSSSFKLRLYFNVVELQLTEHLEGVRIYLNSELSVRITSKSSTHSWLFTVAAKVSL